MILFWRKAKQEGEVKPRRRMGCLGKTLLALLIYFAICGLAGWWFDFGSSSYSLESNSVYKIKLKGTLVEQAPEDNPFAAMMNYMPYGGNNEQVLGLDQLLSNIHLAKTNDKIDGIYLYGGQLAMSPASAKAIRDALIDFKESGKWIIAYAEHYGQLNYYVASVADKIYLNSVGVVEWNGLSMTKSYYTRVLQKIGVEMQVLKVGTFKSAVEPYFRTSMSEADRAQTRVYLDGIWSEMRDAVALSRGIEAKQLDAYADEYMGLQPKEKYLAYKLVDSLVYVQDMDTILARMTETKDYNLVSTSQLALVKRNEPKSDDKIAVVYLAGEISDDKGDGIVGTEALKTLKKVSKNDDVKAVVLRVNSPGGSADASEQIWHAIQLLKHKGLPVVVSMGDYAASGGYYISCGADYIYAEPTTLTGSIGIFGLVPSVKGLREKVGLDVDGVATHRLSDLESNIIQKGMNEQEHALLQNMVERGYDLFTSRCAEGRGMSQDSIKAIGEGRVWLGKDALRLGLVDELGNIDNAVAKAAELAQLEQYKITYYPHRKDFMTELLESLDSSTDEEKLLLQLREFVKRPRVMAIEYFGKIQ